MVRRIAFQKEFFHLPGDLEHFADSGSIPQNQTTIFHPNLIATAQQTSILLFSVPLFQQYHSSQIDVVSKFDDSMIELHCTDKIESIQWQDLEPRLRIGDCFEIHLPH